MYYFKFILIGSIIFLLLGNSTENESKLVDNAHFSEIDSYDFPDQHIKS